MLLIALISYPVALYYEDQKDSALLKAKDFRETRIPKFFQHFERVLSWNAKSLSKEDEKDGWLLGEDLTYADLMLFHLVDGVGLQTVLTLYLMQLTQHNFPAEIRIPQGTEET